MIKSLKLESDDSLEVIMVNDSPEEPLALPEYGNIDIKVIVNEVNSGIHKARVNGLSHAKGDYVIFVDQDDLLMPDTILDYKHKLVDEDLIIANGIYELKDEKKPIFRTKRSQWFASKKLGYVYVRNLIVSPGHCIIRKASIPKEWTNNFMKINGSDDYFLWLLMFYYKKKVNYLYKTEYIHKDTGANLSFDEEKMLKSSMSFIEVMKNIDPKFVKYAEKIEKVIKFKYDYNMLHTDAFHTQVDRVELYIFDKDGRYLFSQVEEGEVLATGYYTMEVKLPVGEYQLLAWAGAHDSYEITIPNGGTTLTEMKLQLMREESLVINKELEPLWYGGINHVKFTGTANQMEVINLIKDTNKIRFIFQGSSSGESRSTDTSGWTINMHDYDYEIIESNGYLGHDNSLLDDDVLSFQPYFMEQKNPSAAAVELNTMRLMEDRPARFVVTEKATGKKVFDINLTDFLILTSMEGNKMKPQEYLDREDEYKIIFFFSDSTAWNAVQININGWTWYIQNEED